MIDLVDFTFVRKDTWRYENENYQNLYRSLIKKCENDCLGVYFLDIERVLLDSSIESADIQDMKLLCRKMVDDRLYPFSWESCIHDIFLDFLRINQFLMLPEMKKIVESFDNIASIICFDKISKDSEEMKKIFEKRNEEVLNFFYNHIKKQTGN